MRNYEIEILRCYDKMREICITMCGLAADIPLQ